MVGMFLLVSFGYVIIDKINRYFGNKHYLEMSDTDQEFYRGVFGTWLHHLVISGYGLYVFATVCSPKDGEVLQVSDSDWKYFRWYDSEICRRTPNQMYVNMIMLSNGYLIWDTLSLFG